MKRAAAALGALLLAACFSLEAPQRRGRDVAERLQAFLERGEEQGPFDEGALELGAPR